MNKNMINTMRTMTIKKVSDVVTSENVLKAMTINAELNALGYTLKPNGIAILAQGEMNHILDDFKVIIGNVSAKPMYPNFPTQVMNLDDATFRFHQLCHYFSTYGMEELFGAEVKRGWLPTVEDTEKIEKDTTLLDLKVLDIIFESEIPNFCIKKLAEKKERFTIEEMELFTDAVSKADTTVLTSMNITFKENLIPIFKVIFESDREDKKEILVSICQHTGDVWKCIESILNERKIKHFKTAEKNLFVKILESYSIADFKANLILSNSKANKMKKMLKYLDYNMYSKSVLHRQAVAELRNNELTSWEGKAKALIANKDSSALSFISERPGMMVRMLTMLLRAGYSVSDISTELSKKADALSTQTLVTLLEHFGRKKATRFDGELHDKKEATEVYEIVNVSFLANLKSKNSELKNKRVYLDLDNFDLELSQLECNNKSPEGGYLTSGLAIKIPEKVKKMRFFVYWNDDKRVDIDLHTYGLMANDMVTHIGWNANFCDGGMVTSGDITHSDAAEFIDIDLNHVDLKRVNTAIDIFDIGDWGCFTERAMKNIETVFVGMMAVDKIGKEVKLYDPKNCFFTHFLKGNESHLTYGIIDIEHRVLIFKGTEKDCNLQESLENKFNLKVYLDEFFKAQNVTIVKDKNECDFVISMEKTKEENGISLIDQNFYLD